MTATSTAEDQILLTDVKIDYLGPARKGYLKRWFNVDTVQGLLSLSVDAVEARFKAEGKTVPREQIEGWFTRAQQLLAERPSPQIVEPADAEAERQANSPPDEWKSLASFLVLLEVRTVGGGQEEQQILARYMPVDKDGIWLGEYERPEMAIEGTQLYQWMLDQLGERAMPPAAPEDELPIEVRPVVSSPSAAPEVNVEITNIRAFQPPKAETPVLIGEAGGPLQGSLRGDEPFALRASFVLTGPAADEVAKEQVPYRAQFYAHNLVTFQRALLGDTEPDVLVESELPYSVTLPEASLEPGMYRLIAVVMLKGPPPVMGHLELPLLQVA
jgi:hypothetical protein